MPHTSNNRPIGEGSSETRPGTRRGWHNNTTPPCTPKKIFEFGGRGGEDGGRGEGDEKLSLYPEMKKWLS